ncbi:MAG: S24 family peptidase [Rickettsiaceae bacterium]|nr:S24 family peptidase [Rickettsiaceae bacterium]
MSFQTKKESVGRPKGGGIYGTSTKPVRVPEHLIQDVKDYSLNNGFKIPYLNIYSKSGQCYLTEKKSTQKININNYLIKNLETTFCFKVPASMSNNVIQQGDILLADYSTELAKGKLLIVEIDGILTIRKINYINNELYLVSLNQDNDIIRFSEQFFKKKLTIIILGVVTSIIRSL